MNSELSTIYPRSAALLPPGFACSDTDALAETVAQHPQICADLPYLPELAAIEHAAFLLAALPVAEPGTIKELQIHPGLELLHVHWRGLPEFINDLQRLPSKGDAYVLLCPGGAEGSVCIITPSSHDLLALKIAAENMTSHEAARQAGVHVSVIDAVIRRAVKKGLLLAPPPTIVRPLSFIRPRLADRDLLAPEVFTLQWHLTQACDLHCRHCYDRQNRKQLTLSQGIQVLEDFEQFCRIHHVSGQISFSGGNPLLHGDFFSLYQEAATRGFSTAILGNPATAGEIDKIIEISRPEFFQVSLEGLKQHNDYIRGTGHFDRVMAFLDTLRQAKIYSMVMLTLTRANMAEVLPLAEQLRNKVDLFTFNRLAMVGEGAALSSVDPLLFEDFLAHYLAAAKGNACMSLKDNLFNILLDRHKKPVFGGCAGYGCGAAFNFVSLLPDGEVHACRKFPSMLGNILDTPLSDIYHGQQAERYRSGSAACAGCELRPVCGSCLAVSHGLGLDIFAELDPYCFKNR